MSQRLVGQSVGIICLVGITVAASCGTEPTPAGPCGVEAQLGQPSGTPVTLSLAPGELDLLQDAETDASVRFPAAGASGAAYLVVGQLATAVSGGCSTYAIGPVQFLPDLRAATVAPRATDALSFHGRLRLKEREMARLAPLFQPLIRTAPARTPPPALNSKRTFRVCGNIDCSSLKNVPSTALFVGTHAAIFVDDSVPAGGFTSGDLATMGDQFDQVLYGINTSRFGAESDIDGNGVVLVLLSRQINALVPKPQCNTSFITGFFFGADVAPGFATDYNNGEVFYGMVPDPSPPAGSNRCAYSTNFVRNILPVTFIHEFQHMISFNQHVLVRGGSDETLWLNEGMSHLAEELAGLHYDSLGDATTANRFFLGDLYNAYSWMRDPNGHALVTEESPGTLEQRGAEWLFLRYIVDQFGPGVTLALSQTPSTGVANVQAATGTSFRTLLARWAVAVYANGLPNFPQPGTFAYDDWDFRAVFASLHAQDAADFPVAWPLAPDSGAGSAVTSTGDLHAGASAYVVTTQAANAPEFFLTLRGPGGGAIPGTSLPQLAIARIR